MLSVILRLAAGKHGLLVYAVNSDITCIPTYDRYLRVLKPFQLTEPLDGHTVVDKHRPSSDSTGSCQTNQTTRRAHRDPLLCSLFAHHTSMLPSRIPYPQTEQRQPMHLTFNQRLNIHPPIPPHHRSEIAPLRLARTCSQACAPQNTMKPYSQRQNFEYRLRV